MEKIFFGLSVTILGLVIVFVCLVILIGAIKCMDLLVRGGEKKKAAPTPPPTIAPQAQAQPALEVQPGIDPGVVAAIAAAVACMDQPQGDGRFVVRSIRRAGMAPAWNRVCR